MPDAPKITIDLFLATSIRGHASDHLNVEGLPAEMYAALRDVICERKRQDAKFGEQNHNYPIWKVILGEELGETDQAWLESTFYSGDEETRNAHLANFRVELVQVAAVALAMIEACDRNGWHIPKPKETSA